MKQKQNYYGNNSIVKLEGADTYRKKPATVLGTDDRRGITHAIFEIVANSVDEALEGYGKEISLTSKKDGTITITDHGRGVPMDWNEEAQEWNYNLIFCTMYASGKYDDGNYASSEGLNGIGCTAAQFTSEFMQVTSCREEAVEFDEEGNPTAYKKFKYYIEFEKGNVATELKKEDWDGETGTIITFKPDIEVFRGADTVVIDVETYVDKLRRKAIQIPGLVFNVYYEGLKDIRICFEDGAAEFIDIVSEGKKLLKKSIKIEGSAVGSDKDGDTKNEYLAKCDITFNFSREKSLTEVYHNGAFLVSGGVSFDGFKLGLLKVIDEYAKSSGKLPKGEKILYRDVEDLLLTVVITNCPGYITSYEHQTKVAINNQHIKRMVNSTVYSKFNIWAQENKDEMLKLVVEVIKNKEAREKAEAIKKKVLKEMSTNADSLLGGMENLKRCSSKVPEERELYLVEGKSASGPVMASRNSIKHAILILRGKPLNCLKEEVEIILKNKVVREIIRAFGCGIELKSKAIGDDLPKFDIQKLNYGKLIICTDADIDGSHIRCLIITLIFRLFPSLLKEGKVFIVEAPLFEIKYKKKSYYAYGLEDRDRILSELESEGAKSSAITIKRMKGLGEADEKAMANTIMSERNRKLIQVCYPEDDEEVKVLLNCLLGDDLASRKELIKAFFAQTANLESNDEDDLEEYYSDEQVVYSEL